MRSDNRLSRMLHVLIHMAEHDAPLTSETIGKMLSTNPVVVRRMMSGLREHGYVQSEKGHGGGWVLTRKLSDLTLLDVYQALGEPPIFALGLADSEPECLVEQAVNAGLEGALVESRRLLLERFATISIDQLARDFQERLKQHPECDRRPPVHHPAGKRHCS